MKTVAGRQIWIAAAALALVCGLGAAQAQEQAPAPPAGGPGPRVLVRTFGEGGGGIGFMGFEAGIAGKTVTNAPFSATVTTQITRTLADGNKIDQTIAGTIARDSQGRTRRDMTLPGAVLAATVGGGAPHAVFINDPVAQTSYILHPDRKVADQVPFRAFRGVRRAVRNQFRVGRRFQNETTTTDLGTQTIDGVTAQGTRITRTIPAGQIGNEKPILITRESWYSPELQTYVLRKVSDPLMGNTVFQLTHIQRADPDPSLFQVPSGYTVKQRAMRFQARRKGETPAPPPQE
jgi:hypothetical protein